MKLTGYGKKEWLGGGIAAALAVLGGILAARSGWPRLGAAIVVIAVTAWTAVAAFFRSPRRRIPSERNVLLSPADGVIKDIEEVRDHGIEIFAGRPLVRIGIFLSVLDVHLNRAPCALRVEYRRYKPGRFLDARDARCSRENESLVIAGEGAAGGKSFPVAVRQISGAIARRIVCDPEPGSTLSAGEVYGMIKFGSRTELFFPAEEGFLLQVRVGDRVRAGETVLVRLKGKKDG